MSFRSGNLLLVAFFSMMLAYFPAEAGNLELLWDPSPDAVSYRLYTSTTPGQFGTSPVWEGTATETSVDGLQNCTMHYFVATAVNAVGESGHSNETSGWPRPEIVGVAPSSVEQGRRLDLIISGTNFQIGSQLSFSDPGIVVHGFSISSCNEIVADVEVTNAAGAGPVDVVVAHPNDVKGTGVGVLSVEAAVAPAVISTSPADGATDVSITVQPTVQFSEPMLGTSITVSSVVLLDDAGSPIAQAAGSPTLSGDGTSATIVPGADLGEGRTYRIRVVGGATGVLDLAGHPMDTTFTQATGFRTAGATAPPVISGVDTSEVLDTSARIVWTTDRPADSQVSYRIVGEATYQQTPVDPTLVTDHEVVLDGLQPGTDYEYHVRSADESGSSSESSPDETFTTVASSYAYLRFEAESGTVAFPVVREAASDVFSGGKVRLPVGSPVGTPAVPSGSVRFGFYAPVSGTYYLWVRVYGSNTGTGSWWESVDGSSRQTVSTSQVGAWVWARGRAYSLSEGLHTLELGGHQPGAEADRILLTDDPSFTATEQPGADVDPPAGVVGFTATANASSNTLTWTNPDVPDLARTVIRYRTDGLFPVSPSDGFPLVDRGAAPGAPESFVHQNVASGVTYSYSAFAVDEAGNASDESTAQATPGSSSSPPPPPTNLRLDITETSLGLRDL